MPSLIDINASKSQNENVESDNNIDENNDEFQKLFEKGADFKNYYPNGNLLNIIKMHKEDRKNKRNMFLKKMESLHRSPLRKMSKFKLNKVTPVQENGKLCRTLTLDTKKEKRRNSNSSIFTKIKESNLFTHVNKQKLSFYDVVQEVLHNQDLKKKLMSSKQKILLMKRKKAVSKL